MNNVEVYKIARQMETYAVLLGKSVEKISDKIIDFSKQLKDQVPNIKSVFDIMLDGYVINTVEDEEYAAKWCLNYDGEKHASYEERIINS